jgi:hypothetical protein
VRSDLDPRDRRASGLVDVLDRVLDKGLVVAGDIKVSLAEVELLTIRIRLLVCSIDKAEQIGLDWWRHESHFSGDARVVREENLALKKQVALLEERLDRLAAGQATKATKTTTTTAKKKPAPDPTTPATKRRRRNT